MGVRAAVDLEERAAVRIEEQRGVKRRNVCEAEQREFQKGKGIALWKAWRDRKIGEEGVSVPLGLRWAGDAVLLFWD